MIEINNINIKFKQTNVFENISIKIDDECKNIVVLRGSNGSGKTTLLRIISGIYFSKDTSVFIDGKEVSHTKYFKYTYKNIFYLPAGNTNLFQRNTVRENIDYFNKLHNSEEHVQFIELYNLIEPFIDENVVVLSSGQRKLVEIYVALTSNNKFLIMDEPLSFIDSTNKSLVINAFEKHPGKILITNHEETVFPGKKELRFIEMGGTKNAIYNI